MAIARAFALNTETEAFSVAAIALDRKKKEKNYLLKSREQHSHSFQQKQLESVLYSVCLGLSVYAHAVWLQPLSYSLIAFIDLACVTCLCMIWQYGTAYIYSLVKIGPTPPIF